MSSIQGDLLWQMFLTEKNAGILCAGLNLKGISPLNYGWSRFLSEMASPVGDGTIPLKGILILCSLHEGLPCLLTVAFGMATIVEIPIPKIIRNTGKRSLTEMLGMIRM